MSCVDRRRHCPRELQHQQEPRAADSAPPRRARDSAHMPRAIRNRRLGEFVGARLPASARGVRGADGRTGRSGERNGALSSRPRAAVMTGRQAPPPRRTRWVGRDWGRPHLLLDGWFATDGSKVLCAAWWLDRCRMDHGCLGVRITKFPATPPWPAPGSRVQPPRKRLQSCLCRRAAMRWTARRACSAW